MTAEPPPKQASRRIIVVATILALVDVVLVGALVWFNMSGPAAPPLAAPVDPHYPDIGMAPLSEMVIGEDGAGRTFLRFSATLVNIGSGPLLVEAHRTFPYRDDWSVVQRVEDGAGGYSERATPTRLKYAGDGHDHWHVIGAEAHQLETLDGSIVGGLVKSGFCFFDNVNHATSLPGAPAQPAHTSRQCGGQFDRDITMGLSVGWGDEYQWFLLDQTIEITDVPDGRYRLRAIADPADLFKESNESNNDTWSVVDLSTVDGHRHVELVEQGPSS